MSANNSLAGNTANDFVGSGVDAVIFSGGVSGLSNGSYVVNSRFWSNGGTPDVGASTWGSGTTGIRGTLSSRNSVVGAAANANLSSVVSDDLNGTYYVSFLTAGGGSVRVGSQFNGFQPAPNIGLGGTATYKENMLGGLLLATGASLSDADSPDFSGGKLSVRSPPMPVAPIACSSRAASQRPE